MEHVIGKFATAIQRAMEEKNVTIRDLAEVSESTYEHTRKIVKGLAFPSKHMRKTITKHLGLNDAEMEKIATEDRIKAKYGKVTAVLSGIPSRLVPLVNLEPYLTDNDITELVAIATIKSKASKKARVS